MRSRKQHQAGTLFAAIAKTKGVTSDELVTEALKVREQLLDAKVKAGDITQAQADDALARMEDRLTDRVDSTDVGRGMGGMWHGRTRSERLRWRWRAHGRRPRRGQRCLRRLVRHPGTRRDAVSRPSWASNARRRPIRVPPRGLDEAGMSRGGILEGSSMIGEAMPTVLVVDDNAKIVEVLVEYL